MTMHHGPYEALIQFEEEENSFYGRVVNLARDGFDFWGRDVDELRAELVRSAEEYEAFCRQLREKLAVMENALLVIEHSGSGHGKTYRLARRAAAILNEGTAYDLTRRLDREAIKVRVLSLLKDRPLRNKEVRAFTDLDRQQVTALLRELEQEGLVRLEGYGAGARWYLIGDLD